MLSASAPLIMWSEAVHLHFNHVKWTEIILPVERTQLIVNYGRLIMLSNIILLIYLWFWAGIIVWLAEKKELEGLGIGVSHMKSGERALLHVGWELGYGKEGSFSFPNVPPMADIIYEVELIGFDETKEVCNFLTNSDVL